MITFEKAMDLVELELKDSGLEIGNVLDDGEYFIFGYTNDVDLSPIGVNKETGQLGEYFPPAHRRSCQPFKQFPIKYPQLHRKRLYERYIASDRVCAWIVLLFLLGKSGNNGFRLICSAVAMPPICHPPKPPPCIPPPP